MPVDPNLDRIELNEFIPPVCTYLDHLPTTEIKHEDHHLKMDLAYDYEFTPRYRAMIGYPHTTDIWDVQYNHKFNKGLPICDDGDSIPPTGDYRFGQTGQPLTMATAYDAGTGEICTYSARPFSPFFWVTSFFWSTYGNPLLNTGSSTLNHWNNDSTSIYGYITPLVHNIFPGLNHPTLPSWWLNWLLSSNWVTEGIIETRGGDAANGQTFLYTTTRGFYRDDIPAPPYCPETGGWWAAGPSFNCTQSSDFFSFFTCKPKWVSGLDAKIRTSGNLWLVGASNYFDITNYQYHEPFFGGVEYFNKIEGMDVHLGNAPTVYNRDFYWPFKSCIPG